MAGRINQLRITSRFQARDKYGSKDILIIAIVALVMVLALVYILLGIIGQSEEHVEKVRETKVDYEESLSWRPDKKLCEKRIYQDLKADPGRKKISYEQLELSDKCFKYIGKMVQLEKLTVKDSIVKDAWLRNLANLPLKNVNLNGCDLTDEGIREIAKIKSLDSLLIGQAQITDESLKLLAEHPNLTFLDLDRTKISDRGLAFLLPKKNDWTHLNLAKTNLTPECVDILIQFKNLRLLNLQGLHLNAAQLEKLSALKNLRLLDLSYSNMTDEDISPIYKFKNLVRLEVATNHLTNEALKTIGKLDKLHFLDIAQSPKISPDAVEQYESSHPATRVKYTKNITDVPADLQIGDIEEEVKLLQDQVDAKREKKQQKKLKKLMREAQREAMQGAQYLESK